MGNSRKQNGQNRYNAQGRPARKQPQQKSRQSQNPRAQRPAAAKGAQRAAAPAHADVAAYKKGNYTGHGSKKRHSRKRRNVVIAVVVAVVLLIAVPAAAFAMSVKDAKADASTLISQGKTLMSQMNSGDKEAAQKTVAELSSTAKELDDTVSSPLWVGATFIPVIGNDIAQVRTIASVADTLSSKALGPLVDALPAGGMSQIITYDTFNVTAISDILRSLGSVSDPIHECAQQVEDMGETHLAQLKEPVAMLKSLMGTLDDVSGHANELAEVLPGMLGVGVSRSYLVCAVSEAEQRCVAGFPGSAGILTMTDGKMDMGAFSSPLPKVPMQTDPAQQIEIPEEERALFGGRVAGYFFDTTFIPDFPRAAELMKAIWDKNGNAPFDGIITVDPVFVQRILALTGGFTTSDGTVVDGTNAAETLMNTVYLKYDENNTAAQDAFFSEVSGAAISSILGNIGSVDLVKFLNTFAQSVEDKRVCIWMSNARDEQVLKDLGLATVLSDSAVDPITGVYFGAAIGCKGYWYLDVDVTVGNGKKNADGSTSYEVTVEFKNTLSEAAAATMPGYITGWDPSKRTHADLPLDIYLFAPVGGSISNMQTDGFFDTSDYYNGDWNTRPGADPMTRTSYRGYEVWYGMTQIAGESSTTLKYTVTTSPQAAKELAVDMSSLANESFQ